MLTFGINKKLNVLVLFCALTTLFVANAQQVTVINNKGTKINVTSNSVTTAAAAPTVPAPVEGDFWFDNTDPANIITNIWDGATWITLAGVSISIVTQTVTVGHEIASHDDGDGTTTTILETVTALAQDDTTTAMDPMATGEITYTDEDGTDHRAQVVSADANNSLTVGTDGGAFHEIRHAEFRPTANINVNLALGARNFFGAAISNDGAITRANNELTINEAGFYQMNFSASLTGNAVRQNPEAILYINNAATRVRASSTYIRNLNGQRESSFNFSYMAELNVGDTIQIRTRQLANGNVVNAIANTTTFTITKIGR